MIQFNTLLSKLDPPTSQDIIHSLNYFMGDRAAQGLRPHIKPKN